MVLFFIKKKYTHKLFNEFFFLLYFLMFKEIKMVINKIKQKKSACNSITFISSSLTKKKKLVHINKNAHFSFFSIES